MEPEELLEKLCSYVEENCLRNKSLIIDTIKEFCEEEDINFEYEYKDLYEISKEFSGINEEDDDDEED